MYEEIISAVDKGRRISTVTRCSTLRAEGRGRRRPRGRWQEDRSRQWQRRLKPLQRWSPPPRLREWCWRRGCYNERLQNPNQKRGERKAYLAADEADLLAAAAEDDGAEDIAEVDIMSEVVLVVIIAEVVPLAVVIDPVAVVVMAPVVATPAVDAVELRHALEDPRWI